MILALLCLPIANCAKKKAVKPAVKKSALVKECVLPPDQVGTILARWKVLPVPIAVKTNNFEPTEVAEISAAVKTWNSFYGQSLSLTVLDSGDPLRSVDSKLPATGTLCSQGILQGNQYAGQVVIYKHGQWPYPNAEVIALTSNCPVPAKPMNNIYMAIMEINYQHFFVEGTKIPDLQSIFLHEFGHLLGLDHSCNTQTKTGFPVCSDPKMPESYLKAVMFPVIPFTSDGKGESRRSLNDNDMGRANCLYQDMKGTASPSPEPSSTPSESPTPTPSSS